jgi:hypothetical protein
MRQGPRAQPQMHRRVRLCAWRVANIVIAQCTLRQAVPCTPAVIPSMNVSAWLSGGNGLFVMEQLAPWGNRHKAATVGAALGVTQAC